LKDEPQERTRWLTALHTSGHCAPSDAEQIDPHASSSVDEISKSLTRQGAKSAKSPSDNLLALLSLPHIGISPHAERARAWSLSWWRLSVSDTKSLCPVSFRPLRCCIQRYASVYARLQHIVPNDVAWLNSELESRRLGSDSSEILQPDFGEHAFHALG
jgi:hypothetical protein